MLQEIGCWSMLRVRKEIRGVPVRLVLLYSLGGRVFPKHDIVSGRPDPAGGGRFGCASGACCSLCGGSL